MTAALALGSSVGDRARSLRVAARLLDATDGIDVLAASAVHATAPFGGVARGVFFNAVCRVTTTLEPEGLLARAKDVESRLGRRPGRRWGDRVVDVDVLLYGDRVVRRPRLVIPHPRLAERDFVLAELYACWPEAPNPWTGRPWAEGLPVRRGWPVVGALGAFVR
jgi:2-amino-4-hydroxy-6-hydroxymethyldihydropteridine diphosphokinase